MIRISICDDDALVVKNLKDILEKIAIEKSINMNIDTFYDGKSFLATIEENNTSFDIVFLDIKMEGIDGLETARKLRERDELAYIIYVTNYKNYAVKAYDVHPYQFLLKPVDENIIRKHFLDIYNRMLSKEYYYEYKVKKVYHRLLLNDVMYFESERRKVIIHMRDGNIYSYYDKLNLIEERMRNSKLNFWRIHQSILVNYNYVQTKYSDRVKLIDGKYLPISNGRRTNINASYGEIIESKIIKN